MEAKNQAAQFKRVAAARALDEVVAGMRLGLGTGSTANVFVELLGERVRAGLALRCVATSEATAALAQRCGIRIETLDELPELDLVVDGADEVGPGLALIKGGGGALLREKIVAAAARTVVIIVDESKVVPVLGRFALPIEVVPFGAEVSRRAIARVARELGLSGEIRLRHADGHVFVTDGGHFIFDAGFGAIPDPAALAAGLSQIPGVVEHGLFIALASQAIVAGPAGVRVLTRQFQG